MRPFGREEARLGVSGFGFHGFRIWSVRGAGFRVPALGLRVPSVLLRSIGCGGPSLQCVLVRCSVIFLQGLIEEVGSQNFLRVSWLLRFASPEVRGSVRRAWVGMS